MRAMTNLEISLAMREINGIAGARLSKFYEISENLFLLKIGGKQLLCELPLRLHFSRYAHRAPQTPSGFAMLMRKHLEGQRLLCAEQHGLDRIAVLTFEHGTLVFELFSHGNAVLLDDGVVIAAYRTEEWKDRKIKRGERYAFPAETKMDPRRIGSELAARLAASKKPLITALCSAINLAPVYLEEICSRAGVDLKKKADVATADEIARIAHATAGFMAEEPKSGVYLRDGEISDFSAFQLKRYAGLESKPFASLSEAADEFYAHAKIEVPDAEKERVERQLEEQKSAMREMLRKAGESRAVGDAVYANFETIERLLRLLREKRDDDARRLVKELKIDRKAGKAVIEV